MSPSPNIPADYVPKQPEVTIEELHEAVRRRKAEMRRVGDILVRAGLARENPYV